MGTKKGRRTRNTARRLSNDIESSKAFQAAHGFGERYPKKRTGKTQVIDARRTGGEQIHPDSPGISPRRPVQTLDLHMDLLRWVTTQGAREQRRRWWELYYASGDNKKDTSMRLLDLDEEEWTEEMQAAGQFAYDEEVQMLSRAMTIHVTSEMAELTHLLAAQQPVRPLRSTDLWFPSGLIFLPEDQQLQYWTPDGENNTRIPMPIKAIGWQWGLVGQYVRDDSKPNGVDMREVQGVKMYLYSTLDNVKNVFGGGDNVTRTAVGPLALMDMSGWAVDSEWEEVATERERGLAMEPVEYDEDAGIRILEDSRVIVANPPYIAYLRKFLMSFWRLLDEEVAVARPEHMPAPARKRAQRLGRIPNDGDVVRVVRLRKIVDIDSGEPMPFPEVARRFTHRWRVQGFWRHLQRGMGLLQDDELILDASHNWERKDGGPVHVRLTDEQGLRERVTIESAVGGIIKLAWKPNLLNGWVEVERTFPVREHTRGAKDGMLIERYDVVSVER